VYILQGSGLAAGFEAVAADDGLRTAIRKAVADAGPRAVWEVVDRETTDRFLFHQPAVGRRIRELWEESGLVNTGEMEAALAKQPPRPTQLADELAALDLPVLILVGIWDRNAGVDACRDLTTRLPNARLHVFHDSAHFPNAEQPEEYVAEVAAFLGGSASLLAGEAFPG
jgi:proline iminopeptidase